MLYEVITIEIIACGFEPEPTNLLIGQIIVDTSGITGFFANQKLGISSHVVVQKPVCGNITNQPLV